MLAVTLPLVSIHISYNLVFFINTKRLVLRVPQNRLSQISQHSSLLIPPYPTDPAFSPYSTALELLRTLSTKSSCYVEATSSLVADCSVLQDDTIDDSVKVIYAVYLAICELKSTGVSYPKECNDLKNSGTPKRQVCIKKLEEKPQYWTTLSNNLQNALVICAATRQEVERGLSHRAFIMGL